MLFGTFLKTLFNSYNSAYFEIFSSLSEVIRSKTRSIFLPCLFPVAVLVARIRMTPQKATTSRIEEMMLGSSIAPRWSVCGGWCDK